jgi:hypothetical protein
MLSWLKRVKSGRWKTPMALQPQAPGNSREEHWPKTYDLALQEHLADNSTCYIIRRLLPLILKRGFFCTTPRTGASRNAGCCADGEQPLALRERETLALDWTSVSAWARVAPQGCPAATASGRAVERRDCNGLGKAGWAPLQPDALEGLVPAFGGAFTHHYTEAKR